jgi:prepilin-type N-terminal cleavage/methylation domain-containing protein
MRGFTFIEIIVVIAVTAIIILLGISAYISLRNQSALEGLVQDIKTTLEEARSKSVSSEDLMPWGVHFEQSQFTLFRGDVFDPAATTNQTFVLGDNLEIATISLANATDDVVFLRPFGATDNHGTLSVRHLITLNERIIKIDAVGTVTIDPAGQVYLPPPEEFLAVVDISDDRVYKHELDGTYLSSFDLVSANDDPAGIGVIETTILVTDDTDEKIYKYDSDGNFLGSFDLTAENHNPTGIDSDSNIIWISDNSDSKAYKYDSAGTPLGNFDYNVSNDDGEGLDAYGNIIAVVDDSDNRVYKYNSSGTFLESFNLDSGNDDAEGIASDGDVYWVVDESAGRVYRYDTDGTYLDNFDLDSANSDAEGIAYFSTNPSPYKSDTRHVHFDIYTDIRPPNYTTFTLIFKDPPAADVQDDTPVADCLFQSGTVFECDRIVSVYGDAEHIYVRSHSLDAFSTLLSISRDQRENQKAVEIWFDYPTGLKIGEYDAEGNVIKGPSGFVGEPEIQ